MTQSWPRSTDAAADTLRTVSDLQVRCATGQEIRGTRPLYDASTLPKREESLASAIGLLGLVPSGKATVSVKGRPVVTVDADRKAVDVEADGVREAGLHLADLVKLQEGRTGMIAGSVHVTGALARLGWKMTLYDEGERILSMGSGVSRLTGHVRLNPLKLRKLLKDLK